MGGGGQKSLLGGTQIYLERQNLPEETNIYWGGDTVVESSPSSPIVAILVFMYLGLVFS